MRRILLVTALCAAYAVRAPEAQAQGDVRVIAVGRPRIGVVVDIKADSAKDKLGARIKEVTPGGPADKAGLKAGDVITRLNGTALGGAKSEDADMSGPGQRLIDLAHDLDTGDTVKVEYRRGAETRTTTLIAREMSGTELGNRFRFDGPGMHGYDFRMPAMGEMPRTMMFRGFDGPGAFKMRMGGLNLIDLNPDLGEYFGTKEGVLVVEAPSDSTIPLKAGDVILALDGRKPKSADHAQRILDSYDPGETIKADIMRKQKRTSITWLSPKPGDHSRWKIEHDYDDDHPGEMHVRPDSRSGSRTPPPSADRS